MVKLKQEQYLEEGNTNSSKRMKKKNSDQLNNNKRRFSDEQIKSMEIIFETQSKLEPRKKLQLARELDLHPRQVAIWFQNKRARYKSKQLERDYNILRDSYNSLASRFDVLKKEKQALTVQLEKLKKELEVGKEEAEHSCKKQNSCDFSFENGEEESIKAEYIMGLDQDEPTSLINMVESVDGSLSCSEDWGGLGTDNLFDESGSSYQWWDMLP